VIQFQSVTFAYEGEPSSVLKGATFAVAPGEHVVLSGPNGCGKTTLLRAVTGLLPIRGSVRLCGGEIARMSRRELAGKAALFSQQNGLYFPYTVYETVLMGRYLHARQGFFTTLTARDREVARACIERVGLAECANRSIMKLSGGQLQRVMLARALAQEPSVILLDEPTNHLDIRHQWETAQYIREWAKTGGHAVLAVFHDLNLTMRIADRVLLMHEGKILQEGAARDVLCGDAINAVYGMDVGAYMRDSLALWR